MAKSKLEQMVEVIDSAEQGCMDIGAPLRNGVLVAMNVPLDKSVRDSTKAFNAFLSEFKGAALAYGLRTRKSAAVTARAKVIQAALNRMKKAMPKKDVEDLRAWAMIATEKSVETLCKEMPGGVMPSGANQNPAGQAESEEVSVASELPPIEDHVVKTSVFSEEKAEEPAIAGETAADIGDANMAAGADGDLGDAVDDSLLASNGYSVAGMDVIPEEGADDEVAEPSNEESAVSAAADIDEEFNELFGDCARQEDLDEQAVGMGTYFDKTTFDEASGLRDMGTMFETVLFDEKNGIIRNIEPTEQTVIEYLRRGILDLARFQSLVPFLQTAKGKKDTGEDILPNSKLEKLQMLLNGHITYPCRVIFMDGVIKEESISPGSSYTVCGRTYEVQTSVEMTPGKWMHRGRLAPSSDGGSQDPLVVTGIPFFML